MINNILKECKGIIIAIIICFILLCIIQCNHIHSWLGIPYTFIIVIVGSLIGMGIGGLFIKLFELFEG